MPEPTIQTTFNISPELYERLKRRASGENRSMREIVVDALDLFLSEPEPTNVVRSKSLQEEAVEKAKK